jgi:MarR-like DNA-binding transcriptional regulator SgrR of sgrS sRNA
VGVLLFSLAFSFGGSKTSVAKAEQMKEIRTYMAFSSPVDPVKIETIPDMDMSYALASTLIEWDDQKQLSGALSDKWKILDEKTYRLTLRDGIQWSDGSPLTAEDVKRSFQHGFNTHPTDLRSLTNMVATIDCPSEREIDFHLRVPALGSGLLTKLTEPNYGILKIAKDGSVDLSVSSGPYFLERRSSSQELALGRNKFWFHEASYPQRASQVIVRKPPADMNPQNILLTDSWPNLIETSSLIRADLLDEYTNQRYDIWRRPLDKVFYAQIGKRPDSADARILLQYLRANVDPSEYAKGLSGFTIAEQFFPNGFQLYDSSIARLPKSNVKIPARFHERPVDVVISISRVPSQVKENIRAIILKATGIEPHFIPISLDQYSAYRKKGDFDLYVGTVGLADPEPEGAMSYYLENESSTIQTSDNDFLKRLDEARKHKDIEGKLKGMRSILVDAVCNGYLLPMFHLSTIGIARAPLDLSQIPDSEESATFSKIRFRE